MPLALGGISSWDSAETTDENPERVAALRALVWGFLRTALYRGDPAWADANTALAAADPVAIVESKWPEPVADDRRGDSPQYPAQLAGQRQGGR